MLRGLGKGTWRRKIAPIAILALCICSLAEAGENDWFTKPFQKWTKSEALEMLNNSPWARTQEIRSSYGISQPVDFKFTARLRSALPVRQALVRLKQIEARYDSMNENERADFDAKTKGLLDCPACADNYVVSLSSRSENSPGWDLVYRSYSHMTLNLLEANVFLGNEGGERRRIIHFTPPRAAEEEALFFFPRFDANGRALFSPSDKKILFYLNPQTADSVKNFEFDVSKLVKDSQVMF
jgi:hypothetical protein